MASKYNENSIKRLDPLAFTRLRPDTYCGSTSDSTQLVTEIVSNAVDEHLIGNCDTVWVTIDQDSNVVTVIDNGQGIIPNNKVDKDKTTLEMVYGDINSSGKFDKSDDAVYEVSTGAFGIGAALTNYLSHWLQATTYRDGKYETVYFKEGVFDRRESGTCDKSQHGVEVIFLPSEEFFTDARPNSQAILDAANKITCVCPNLTYYFNDKKIQHQNGLDDFLSAKISDESEFIQSRFLFKQEDGRQSLDFGMTICDSGDITAFCNYSLIESGTPVAAIKGCITRTLNKWGHEQNLLREKESLSGANLQEGMVIVFNLVSPAIRYDSQTKVRVTSTDDNEFLNKTLSRHLELWLDSNPSDARAIIEKALLARRAAEAARKAREAVKAGSKKKKNKVKILHPDKLKDAEFLGEESILTCVEGK